MHVVVSVSCQEQCRCPVTHKFLEEPVTLDSGHSLSFTAAAQRLTKVGCLAKQDID